MYDQNVDEQIPQKFVLIMSPFNDQINNSDSVDSFFFFLFFFWGVYTLYLFDI